MSNLKYKKTGSELIKTPVFIIALIITFITAGYFIAKGGILTAILVFALPFVLLFLFEILKNPSIGIITLVVLSFIIPGLVRYITTEVGIGLSLDAIILLTYISVFLKGPQYSERWKWIKSDLFILSLIWLLYNILELANPLAMSKVVWFYAIRPVSLYLILVVPLIFMLGNTRKFMMLVLYTWAGFSILATIKAAVQLHIGLDPWELKWLADGAAETHMLFGKLRVFSYFSDAGQFGAAQAHIAVVGLILASVIKNPKGRLLFLIAGLGGIYGMMISGTRGAIAIPFIGAFTYVLLRKDIKMIIVVCVLTLGAYLFLNHTYIGNSNYTIYRMRTAFDKNDASFQVRLHNQQLFKDYLKDKPFGGGVGSVGHWGSRFTPGTFLANLPSDSWYVQIWAEQGIIGLILYLIMLLYILSKSFFIILFKLKHKELRIIMIALVAGLFGVFVTSYSNNTIGQIPTSILSYFSIVFLFDSEKLEFEYFALDKKNTNEIKES
ncbi:MAG: O-antigen ligase domain-containing protein [Bacteroidetes bacterium]|jgi:hypothetical protein|nr:O-antigen ligase domain-containing protein [Bacteroidota bacterium]MBT7996600.1 O-antigen ligase domain-containing protein [Bacteroidota bacterium]